MTFGAESIDFGSDVSAVSCGCSSGIAAGFVAAFAGVAFAARPNSVPVRICRFSAV